MKYRVVGALLLWALPTMVFGAGFVKQSLFLSKSSVTEGEVVLIHAVIGNESAEAFAGELLFTDNGKAVGSVPVSLSAGEAETASVSWKPLAGSHKVSATLKTKAGTLAEEHSETFSIKEKPISKPEPQAQAAAVESSQ